ncbi:unnamed protein product [Amaranthus hypochondriacus]
MAQSFINGNGNATTLQSSQTPLIETTDVCDANSPLLETGELRVLKQMFQPFGARRAFSGQVVTVKSFEDNAVVVEAIFENKCHEPKVLVIDAGGSLRRAMIGSLAAQVVHDMGWVGVVVNGCVRDVDQINNINIGVRALGSAPVRPSKKGGGEKHVTVQFAGALIRDGDWLCADSSGIVVASCELTLLGPIHRPLLLNHNDTNMKCCGSFCYTHIMADYTSPVEPNHLFQAYCLDDFNFLPKFVPQSFESIELLVGESTAVGCIKLFKFSKGQIFKFMKNRVDKLDQDNLYIKYTTIEGDILRDKWDHIVYEIKIKPSIIGSHFKMIGYYHAKEGAMPIDEDVTYGQKGFLMNTHKAIQEALFTPQVVLESIRDH